MPSGSRDSHQTQILGLGKSSPALPLLTEDRGRQERRERQTAFASQEREQSSLARSAGLRDAARWALATALLGSLLAWLAGYLLQQTLPASTEWVMPSVALRLLLGAVCGGMGGAAIGLFFGFVAEEDRDIPVIILGTATLVVITSAVYAAGGDGPLQILTAVAIGVPTGLLVGFGVWAFWVAMRWTYRLIGQELGHK